MDETTTVQGREITQDDIELVRRLIEANPSRNRTQLSKELCLLWNWRAANGQIKDMACRTLLLKLEQRGHITLPISTSFNTINLLCSFLFNVTISFIMVTFSQNS